MVPFFDLKRQYGQIEDEIVSATRRVYEKGRFILGEEVSSFEAEFARYCGVKHGVGVGSGTDALHLALRALGIGAGGGTDGQVLVVQDVLGISSQVPRFAKAYGNLGQSTIDAIAAFRREVTDHVFPGPEHAYGLPDEEWRAFLASVGHNLRAVPAAR